MAAWDFHDEATAAALCGAKDSLCQGLDDYYVRARITEMGPPTFDDTDGMLPSGATGVDIEVSLAGETRDGGQVDVGGLVLAPAGPRVPGASLIPVGRETAKRLWRWPKAERSRAQARFQQRLGSRRAPRR